MAPFFLKCLRLSLIYSRAANKIEQKIRYLLDFETRMRKHKKREQRASGAEGNKLVSSCSG